MSAEPLGWVGIVAASGAAATALVAGGRARALAMLAALVLAPAIVAGDVWDTERFVELRDSPGHLAVLAILGAGGIAAVAWGLRRWPAALPLLAFAALPFRVPVDLGGEDANLLIPLYIVIGGGVLSAASPPGASPAARRMASRGPVRGRAPRPSVLLELAVRALPWLLGGFLVLYAIQSAYSDDFSKAVENVGFFFVPFAVLLALLSDVRWTRQLLRRRGGGRGGRVAAVRARRVRAVRGPRRVLEPRGDRRQRGPHLLPRQLAVLGPERPGRYLVLAILLLAGADGVDAGDAARGGRRCACGSLLVAAGADVLAVEPRRAARRPRRARRAALEAALGGSRRRSLALVGDRARRAERRRRRHGHIAQHPLRAAAPGSSQRRPRPRRRQAAGQGYGSGSFQVEFSNVTGGGRRRPARCPTPSPSPSPPSRDCRPSPLHRRLPLAAFGTLLAGSGPPGLTVARSALFACFVAMVVHSLGYAGLLIDPVTWTLLGVGLALARRPHDLAASQPGRDAPGAARGPRRR